ncbi:hypothetical protein NDU88_007916 [Pleurodeles waltl]|uniref:Uncharacterized protein n=1 Tax=Pleurodeles waltl TaxID=8319 RepID=A0AAV7N3F6_PLEWA|nr:hypothetical protein NDU88_007916 [Pleurodeles waltl]
MVVSSALQRPPTWGRPNTIVEKLLTNLFGRPAFTETFVVEHAHRSLGPWPFVGVPPCTIIACLHDFHDRDTVLHLARAQAPLQYQGSTISIFSYFTIAVQDARCKFADAKIVPHKHGLKYGMLYTAWFRVDMDDRYQIFTNPADFAHVMVDTEPRKLSQPDAQPQHTLLHMAPLIDFLLTAVAPKWASD